MLLNDKQTKFAMIVGKYVCSGGFTDVIGGTMTAGAMTNSVLLTWAPPFISAPSVLVSVQSGIDGGAIMTGSNFFVALTGVGVSNAYLAVLNGGGSGNVVSVLAIGEARL